MTVKTNNYFGEKLRDIRNMRNMTQEELSEKSGIGIRMISRYELGDTIPRLDKLEQLAEALEVNPATLCNIDMNNNNPESVFQAFLMMNDYKLTTLIKAYRKLPEQDQQNIGEIFMETTGQNLNDVADALDYFNKSNRKESCGNVTYEEWKYDEKSRKKVKEHAALEQTIREGVMDD